MLKNLISSFALIFIACLPFQQYSGAGYVPPQTETVYVISPSLRYRLWFDEVQKCSGFKGNFSRIYWYAVAGTGFSIQQLDGHYDGFFSVASNGQPMIFLAQNELETKWIIQHEELHFLIWENRAHVQRLSADSIAKLDSARRKDEPIHPSIYFRQRCKLMREQQLTRWQD